MRDFAAAIRAEYDRIDVLVLNAGVMKTPYGLPADGFELQMGTNVIGPFLLAKALLDITTMSSMRRLHASVTRSPAP